MNDHGTTNLPSDVLTAELDDSRSSVFAQRISRIFHPIAMTLLALLLVGVYAFDAIWYGLTWALVCVLAQALPPIAYFMLRRRQGAYSDADVSLRHQRNELYIAGLVTLVVGILILRWFGLPAPFLAVLIASLAIGLINATVNLFWKISAHATCMATTATVAMLYSYWLGLALWVCAVLVGWARVRTRNHTPAQVLAGFIIATVAVLVAFRVIV